MDSENSGTAYSIEDQYEDPIIPSDSWGQFLSMRFRERKSFYDNLNAPEQQMIWKELQRIEYFRDTFKSRKLSATDTIPLDSLLEEARNDWNAIAFERCERELAKRRGIETEERNCHILREVQRRGGVTTCVSQFLISSENDSVDLENYNPDEPDYGYNGWLMAFADGRRGIDNPLCYGEFPHQKISIRQLLYNKTKTPLTRMEDKDQLRYFHLPANNMAWVEQAMSRYYGEDKLDFGAHRVLNARSKSERLLKHELWRGQQRGGVGSPVHSRQIGSRFSLVPSAPFDAGGHATNPSASSSQTASNGTDIALFMPYLHWEIEKRLQRMSKIVQRQTAELKPEFGKHSINFRSKFADLAGNWRIKLGQLAPTERRQGARRMPSSALGKYLWFAAKLFEIIDEAADERLISEHLHSTSPLHMRRTLDQFYYWTVIDTTAQDQDQVVCHGTRSSSDPEATGRVVMVDQLWMWILDQNTIVTSFPRRWGRNKPDPSAVHRAIRDHFGRLDRTQKRSIYDLALVIIDECSRVFFDRTKPLDQRPEVVAIFGSAISDIAEMRTMAYERFGRDVSAINAPDSVEDAEELIRKSLNISFEWSVLIEAQHIIDELQIMQEIFTQQIVVIRDFEKTLKSMGVSSSTLERAATVIRDMEMRRNELAGLEKLQEKTRVQLRELLDMKQQQAGIIEAKAAIKRADESVLQGRSIVVFTVFTIFFLPLSFLAAVFGMNAREFNSDPIPLGTEIKYMFSLSSVVIFFSLAFAFSTWARTVIAVGGRISYAYATHWMGIHNISIWKFQGTSTLKEFEKETILELRRKALLKRIREINAAINEPPPGDQGRRNSWGTVMSGTRGFRNRRTPTPDSEAA
ncbi:hypothetical protein BJ875DRAFT_374401 [Amylocarpus encephaloides]|uniref:Uncharacterized protein n=1 Tax=Amylocarpus encephaloides TaxID=45428 RepID=A0A9P8C650_9HELO|nr:hypothetical protein BJ875DRAFT_374401 [Amylocarpus encephaloides]